MAIKATKRSAAKFLRNVAKTLEEFGWIQGRLGNERIGFCLIGGMDHTTSAGDVAVYSLAYDAMHTLVHNDPVHFNDHIATSREQVTSACRRTARALEHGLQVKA